MSLSPTQLARFRADGFIVVPQLVDAPVLATLRGLYDRFMSREIDAGINDRLLGGLTRQIMSPSRYHPFFVDNPAVQAGLEIGRQVYADPVRASFSMLISKPPGSTKVTPWHQDAAYHASPFLPEGVKINNYTMQFWVALDDVDIDNGCMHFIPGVHLGPSLKHHVYSGVESAAIADPAKRPAQNETPVLETLAIDASRAVACPLKAGGCTIHFEGTPHFTPGNITTDRQRRAYIFNIQCPAASPYVDGVVPTPKTA